MNTPKIRFKGFTDDWEQRKLSDCAEFRRGSFPQPYGNKDWYDGKGAMPFVQVADVSSDMKLVNDTKQKISKLAQPMSVFAEKGSVLVTLQGSIGRVAITQYGAFVDRTVLIFDKYKDDIDKKFWAYIIKEKFEYEAKKAPGGTIKTITKEVLANFDLMLPCYAEQSILADYLIKLDHLITLHQRKCDETKQLKKFMLQKMFPKNGEKNPEIRFEGFTDDWEQRKFGELFSRRMERNLGQFDNTRWISVARMYFQDPDRVTSNNIDTRTYVMREGDIAFEGHSNQEYRYGRFVANDIGDGVISELFPIYQHIVPYDNNYWKYAIQIETIMAPKILRCIEISYTSSNKLDEKFFLEESTSVPGIEEQRKIGALLSNLDNLIALHQRKCEKLKELKKYMLQNMFV